MPGFNRDTTGATDQNVLYADNVDFTGSTAPTPTVTTNGQLLIGSTATPNIKVGTLTSPNGTITIGYSSPNITIDTTGGQSLTKLGVDTTTATGTNPVLPDATGLMTSTGGQYPTGTFGTRVVTINSQSPNHFQVLSQISTTNAVSLATKNGISHFDSVRFTVDANGFVSLNGTGVGETITGDTGGAVPPTAGNWNIIANVASNTCGATVKTVGTPGTSTLTLNVTDASENTLVGNLAGNATLTSTNSTALGSGAFNAATSGSNNTAIGRHALFLNTSGQNNVAVGTSALAAATTGGFATAVGSLAMALATNGGTAVGYAALGNLTTGQNNCCVGISSGGALVGGNNNTAIGQNSGASWVSASDCTALGDGALFASTGDRNTAVGSQSIFAAGASTQNTTVGYQSGLNVTSGSQNSVLGYQGLLNATTGSYNTCLGYSAGSNYTTSESSNICVINTGTLAESNTTRIGTQGSGSGQQNKCFIAGIVGVTVSNPQIVTINSSTGQLGVTTSSELFWNVVSTNQTGSTSNGYIFVSPGGALTISLPTTSAVGDEFAVVLDGATSWQITQAAGQQVRVGSLTSTLGATGSLTSTAQGDTLMLVCRVANTIWTAISVIGTITVA